MDSALDYPYLLAVHTLCADGQLHQNELLFVRSIARTRAVSPATEQAAQAILSQEKSRLTLEAVMQGIPAPRREDALFLAMLSSYFDGAIDSTEQDLLEGIRIKWRLSQSRFAALQQRARDSADHLIEKRVEAEDSTISTMARLLRGIDTIIGEKRVDRIVSSIGSQSFHEKIREYRLEALFAGPKYDEAIRICQEIGSQDMEVVDQCYRVVTSSLRSLRQGLQNQVEAMKSVAAGKNADTAKTVLSEIEALREHVDQHIEQDLGRLKEVHRKKRRAMPYYTIAFMGRSKAGKSTLHAALTGGGWDEIGVGRQNTTRLNRVYEWKHLRIIDTPGIITPGGKELGEIASSVVDEADLICFVMTNDNQQAEEFRFFEQLRRKGKSLVVLLNMKEDLTSPVRLKRFLTFPDRLFSDDKTQLGGHLDRIRRDVGKYYGNTHFPIIPVQLLAARMAMGDPADPHAAALMKASRFQNFIDSLRLSLLKEGAIRRSQNLLGSSVPELKALQEDLLQRAKGCSIAAGARKQQAENSSRRLKQMASDCRQRLAMDISKIFSSVRDEIPGFAEDHRRSSPKKLNAAWAQLVESHKIQKKTQASLAKATEGFNAEMADLLDEIDDELRLITQISLKDAQIKKQGEFWNSRNIQLMGSITFIGLVFLSASLPVFIIATAVLLIATSIAPNKAKVKAKALAKLTKDLEESIQTSESDTLKAILKLYDKQCAALSQQVVDYFNQSASALSDTGELLKNASRHVTTQITFLNKHYAARILAFASGEPTEPEKMKWHDRILSVDRMVGDYIRIRLDEDIPFSGNEAEISLIIQETASIQHKSKKL